MGGATQSVHNDTDEPVEVWYQLYGWPGGFQDTLLFPGKTTIKQKLGLSLPHQICVEYREHYKGEKDKVCKGFVSPHVANKHTTRQVSTIIGKGTLPSYSGPHLKLSALEHSRDFEHSLPLVL